MATKLQALPAEKDFDVKTQAKLARIKKARMWGLEPMSWFFFIVLIATLRLVPNIEESSPPTTDESNIDVENHPLEQPCSEFYVVREGETLYSIAEKCKDPLIWLWNPHVEDPDDVYPGVILRLNLFYD
ncbi:cell wall macromolecule catabolic process [Spatholobus suberectus]|nr:cell wall macromolecule catabolic process [Spatholobus suberectus]